MFCMPRAAQEPPTNTSPGVAEHFKQLDGDGDGRLSASEAGKEAFFRRADVDEDGFVTLAEARSHARRSGAADRNRTAGMEGDGARPMATRVKPVHISESDCPIQAIDATSNDGRAVRAFHRVPKGDGPFPAVVFVHGGLTHFPDTTLQQQLRDNPVITRMLAAGYAVVKATFRTYEQDVLSRGPVEDVRAIVRALAKSPQIDPHRIALFGGSGGGNRALELGGDEAVQAVIAGEPATLLFTGMLTTGDYGPRLEIMAAPGKYFTPEVRERTLQKLKTLRAPVLIVHSDQHDLHKFNGPLFVPLMQQAGVTVEYREYPGYGHGFYFGGGDDRWGKGADEKVVSEVVRDVLAFLAAVSGQATDKPDKR
jgi:acetyl esterase/lipase